MLKDGVSCHKSYSLLVIIVNRHKGSKILQCACKMGVSEASAVLGRGTIKNESLDFLELNEVYKEVIFIVVSSDREEEILDKLDKTFHFSKPNHGIAFTVSLAGILKMKRDSEVKWKEANLPLTKKNRHTAVWLIVDKGKADEVINIAQDAGYFGGTIMKAHGSADNGNKILNMKVEPEKEVVLMITETSRVKGLAVLLNEKLRLNEENTGIMTMVDVNNVVGLFDENN